MRVHKCIPCVARGVHTVRLHIASAIRRWRAALFGGVPCRSAAGGVMSWPGLALCPFVAVRLRSPPPHSIRDGVSAPSALGSRRCCQAQEDLLHAPWSEDLLAYKFTQVCRGEGGDLNVSGGACARSGGLPAAAEGCVTTQRLRGGGGVTVSRYL